MVISQNTKSQEKRALRIISTKSKKSDLTISDFQLSKHGAIWNKTECRNKKNKCYDFVCFIKSALSIVSPYCTTCFSWDKKNLRNVLPNHYVDKILN